MTQSFSMRINLSTREFEIAGDKEFVQEGYREFLERFDKVKTAISANVALTADSGVGELVSNGRLDLPSEFGEFLHRFDDNLPDTDRMLVASLFSQEQSDDRGFTTRDANQLLLEQGHKLSNPSECNRRNVANKRVFALGGGKRYRVSQVGSDHVIALLRNGHL